MVLVPCCDGGTHRHPYLTSGINVCLALSITVTPCTTKNMLLFYNKEKDYGWVAVLFTLV